MRTGAILSTVVVALLAVAGPSSAQKGEDGFPGMGSIDAWRSSRPEYRQGMQFMKQSKWDQAIARFRAALALYPDDFRCHLEIGRAIEAKGGAADDAEAAYRSALRINSQSWRAWKGLANIYFSEKKYASAREAVDNARQLSPPAKAQEELNSMVKMIDSALKEAGD